MENHVSSRPSSSNFVSSDDSIQKSYRIQALIRKELLAGAELAFAFVLARYPTLDLELIAKADVELDQYYPVAKHPAHIIVSRMEAGTERSLRTRTDQGATT